MIVVQGILSVLLGAMVVGIMFARISHPHYRGRSIYMSDRASIARRDGTLKLMFRIADIRRTQVCGFGDEGLLGHWVGCGAPPCGAGLDWARMLGLRCRQPLWAPSLHPGSTLKTCH